MYISRSLVEIKKSSLEYTFKVSNIFLCLCCFRPTWLSFRCWPTLINPFTDCFHWEKLPTLFWNFCNNNPKPSLSNVSIRALSSYDILPITKVIGLTAIMTWNIEEFRAILQCYVARKHKNNDVTTKMVLVTQLI